MNTQTHTPHIRMDSGSKGNHKKKQTEEHLDNNSFVQYAHVHNNVIGNAPWFLCTCAFYVHVHTKQITFMHMCIPDK